MWKVVNNQRSKHIYIKDEKENSIRAVAMIPTGMMSEQSQEDAQLIADAPKMRQLLTEIKSEGYLSFSLERKINDLLGVD